MSNGTFYSLGAKYLSHYGRKGMKWGKNIFGDAMVGPPRSAVPANKSTFSAKKGTATFPGTDYRDAFRALYRKKYASQDPRSNADRMGKKHQEAHRLTQPTVNSLIKAKSESISDYAVAQKNLKSMINNYLSDHPTRMNADQRKVYEAYKAAMDHPPTGKDGNPTSHQASLDNFADEYLSGKFKGDTSNLLITPFEAFYLKRKYNIVLPGARISNNTQAWGK